MQEDPNKDAKRAGMILFFSAIYFGINLVSSIGNHIFFPCNNDTVCLVIMADEPPEKIDLSCFSGILRCDADEKSRNCWTVPDSKLFKVRSKNFPHDKSKVQAFIA